MTSPDVPLQDSDWQFTSERAHPDMWPRWRFKIGPWSVCGPHRGFMGERIVFAIYRRNA